MRHDTDSATAPKALELFLHAYISGGYRKGETSDRQSTESVMRTATPQERIDSLLYFAANTVKEFEPTDITAYAEFYGLLKALVHNDFSKPAENSISEERLRIRDALDKLNLLFKDENIEIIIQEQQKPNLDPDTKSDGSILNKIGAQLDQWKSQMLTMLPSMEATRIASPFINIYTITNNFYASVDALHATTTPLINPAEQTSTTPPRISDPLLSAFSTPEPHISAATASPATCIFPDVQVTRDTYSVNILPFTDHSRSVFQETPPSTPPRPILRKMDYPATPGSAISDMTIISQPKVNTLKTMPYLSDASAQYSIASYGSLRKLTYDFFAVKLPASPYIEISAYALIGISKIVTDQAQPATELLGIAWFTTNRVAVETLGQQEHSCLTNTLLQASIGANIGMTGFGLKGAMFGAGFFASAELLSCLLPQQDKSHENTMANAVAIIQGMDVMHYYSAHPTDNILYMAATVINYMSIASILTHKACDISSGLYELILGSSTEHANDIQ